MVAAVEEHAVRQAELPRVQRQHHLDAARPAVDEVAVEHVERVLVGPPVLREDVQQIRELTVEVADDGDALAGLQVYAADVGHRLLEREAAAEDLRDDRARQLRARLQPGEGGSVRAAEQNCAPNARS